MKKRILLGSIGAVVILILISFTNVVGVQSSLLNTINNSPLFEYRTKKAIKKTPDTFQCSYIGKEKICYIPFSTLDQKEQLILKFIEFIVKMDENTFNTLLIYCLNKLVQDNKVKNTNIAELLFGLKNIRKNPRYIIDQITNKTKETDYNYEIKSQQYTIDSDWIPGCLLTVIFYMLFIYPILLIFLFISAYRNCFESIDTNCENCPCYRVQINKYLYDLDML